MDTLYTRLSTRSRRALVRQKKRGSGKPYYYSPRGTLLERLSRETGLSMEQVYNGLLELRQKLIGGLGP